MSRPRSGSSHTDTGLRRSLGTAAGHTRETGATSTLLRSHATARSRATVEDSRVTSRWMRNDTSRAPSGLSPGHWGAHLSHASRCSPITTLSAIAGDRRRCSPSPPWLPLAAIPTHSSPSYRVFALLPSHSCSPYGRHDSLLTQALRRESAYVRGICMCSGTHGPTWARGSLSIFP